MATPCGVAIPLAPATRKTPRIRRVVGWYWVAGWDSDVPRKNTCASPCATPEEAKAQAVKYVKHHLANKEISNTPPAGSAP